MSRRHGGFSRHVSALVFALLASGCSGAEESGPAGQGSDEPYTGYPDSITVLGHSAVTGEGTAEPGVEAKDNSWATGTSPGLASIYQRILDRNPAIKGHATNLGTASADLSALASQARTLVAQKPHPELVLVATLDADITCPASLVELQTYGAGLRDVMRMLSSRLPASRFFITTQVSTPSRDATIYTRAERAAFGGTGPCAFLQPDGHVDSKELRRLERVIAAYKAQVETACSQTERCSTDQSGEGWTMQRSYYSDDLNHLNLRGQAAWAQYVWGRLQEAHLVPTG